MSTVYDAGQPISEPSELQHDGDRDESATRARRVRVAAACDECRSKKIKCDGNQPVCGPCRRRWSTSAECNWGVRKGRSVGVTKEDWMRLKRRLDALEDDTRQSSDHDPPPKVNVSVDMSPHTAGLPALNDTGANGDENNAMMGLMEHEHRQSSRHHGDSSATSFMNQIKSVIEQQLTPPSDVQATPTMRRAMARPAHSQRRSSRNAQFLDYVLPSRQRADHLLKVYWRLVDTLYPFLDTDEVESLYQRLWAGIDLGEESTTFLCLVNVIFSIACVLDPGTAPAERVKCAEVFFQRAQELLNFELIQQRSILSVQCFLLLGQYLQSTNDPQQCWIFVGLAIRVAQSLGLDLPSTSAEAPSAHRRDVLRKVWHGCVLMDRTLSMTFGRPAIITSTAAAAVPRPMAHLEPDVCRCFIEEVEPNESSSHFFIEALSLYELMSETLHILYNPVSQEESSKDTYTAYFGSMGWKAIGDVLEMDTKITAWRRSLPFHLRHNHDAVGSIVHRRQSRVLWLRYLHIRILLFRPVLSRFCSRQDTEKSSFEDTLPWQIALRCSIACVKTALETIGYLEGIMADRTLENFDDLLPAWWYCIFYVYTSAMVLVAARLQSDIVAEVTSTAIVDAWQAVMKILKRFQNFNKHAKRCAAAVSVLFDQVPQQLDQHQENVGRRCNGPTNSGTQQQSQDATHHQQGDIPTQQRHLQGASRTPVVSGETRFAATARPSMPLSTPGFLGSEMIQNSVGTAESFTFSHPYPVMDGDDASTAQFSSTSGLFDTSNLQFDLDDMSWLSSLPSQLYGP